MLSPRGRAATLTAAYYALVFGALGAHLPYWPVWLESWGLSATEIGMFLGAAMLTKIAGTTLLPAIADRYAIRRGMIVISACGCAAVAVSLPLLPERNDVLLAVTLIWAILMAPSVPLGEALGLRAAGRNGFAYAPVRAAGSIAFLLANVGVGALLERLGPNIILWVVAAGFVGVAIAGWKHPGGGAPPGVGSDRATLADIKRLVRSPVFVLFAIAMATAQAAHMVYYTYSVLDWRAVGIGGATIGQLWALGVLVETMLMLGPGRRWVARLGAGRAMALAALAGVIRWGAMTQSPDLLLLWPLQAMHAITFGLAHLGAMAFLAAAIPPRLAGTAQGLASGLATGAISAGVIFAAGALVGVGGSELAYGMACALAAVSAFLCVGIIVVWDGRVLVSEEASLLRGRTLEDT